MEWSKFASFAPKAKNDAILLLGNARFTVLTPYLLRMEFDTTASFEDRPSQIFMFRDQPVPEFQVLEDEQDIQIKTKELTLNYKKNKLFTPYSLSIHLHEKNINWHFGDQNNTNLRGTFRTLDTADGSVDLDLGLNSLSGWSLVDDSTSLVFSDQGWLVPRGKPTSYQDLYFFGYGSHFLDCIQDFQLISGKAPLLPRWALGNWWSRYWAYSQNELLELTEDFSTHKMPLSVCIIDMDWHITDTRNKSTGWTGYTWNKNLFPEPEKLLQDLHQKDLKVALNLHPAEGVHPHEGVYPDFAQRMGIDPLKRTPIPFDIADQQFASAYFDLLHKPLERMGVDFWWIDWQQGNKSSIPQLDPLFWLNHLHSLEQMRDGTERPFIFSRWPGLGGHRYPIGFSGDTVVSWASLDFQPYFTSTAANVAFGWWSHDIGGHMGGIEEPELFLRWLQFGVFSPIMRLHSTKNPFNERRPWAFGCEVESIAQNVMQLRHQLVPYIYTSAYSNEVNGIPLVFPMYFLHPEDISAYQCRKQYYFGSELVVAPFTQPIDPNTKFCRQVLWLPEGDWFNFFTGEYFKGGGWISIYGRLEDIPVFAKAGAIIPLSDDPFENLMDNPHHLNLNIFVGRNHHVNLYEDDGHSLDYRHGSYSLTRFEQLMEKDTLTIKICKPDGDILHVPEERSYSLIIFGISKPSSIECFTDHALTPSQVDYDEKFGILRISSLFVGNDRELIVRIQTQSSLTVKPDLKLDRILSFITLTKLNSDVKNELAQKMSEYLSNPKKFLAIMHHFKPEQLLAISEIAISNPLNYISYSKEEELNNLYQKFR